MLRMYICPACKVGKSLDSVKQPADSGGFICPACKAKISGQINVLDSGSRSSTNSDQFWIHNS